MGNKCCVCPKLIANLTPAFHNTIHNQIWLMFHWFMLGLMSVFFFVFTINGYIYRNIWIANLNGFVMLIMFMITMISLWGDFRQSKGMGVGAGVAGLIITILGIVWVSLFNSDNEKRVDKNEEKIFYFDDPRGQDSSFCFICAIWCTYLSYIHFRTHLYYQKIIKEANSRNENVEDVEE